MAGPRESEPMALRQGDLGLLESDVAKRLLASSIPARFAYLATDGTPRVLSTWFHWTGELLVMPTFLAAPHVRHGANRLRALRVNPDVAVTIDTQDFPPEALTVRGRASITDVVGVVPEDAMARPPLSGRRRSRCVHRPDRSARHTDGPHRRSSDVGRKRPSTLLMPPNALGSRVLKSRRPHGLAAGRGQENVSGELRFHPRARAVRPARRGGRR